MTQQLDGNAVITVEVRPSHIEQAIPSSQYE